MTTDSSPISNVNPKQNRWVNNAWFWVFVTLSGGVAGTMLFDYSPPKPLAKVPFDPPTLPLEISPQTTQAIENTKELPNPLWSWQVALDAATKRDDAQVAAEILQKIALYYLQHNQPNEAIQSWQLAAHWLRKALKKQNSLLLQQQLADLLEQLSDAQLQQKQNKLAWDTLNEAYQWRQHIAWQSRDPNDYLALQQTYQKFAQLWQNAPIR
jgi:hypothetical protein